jgi:hypothetical protein
MRNKSRGGGVVTLKEDNCPDGETCPRVFETSDGDIVVQGYVLAGDEAPGVATPPAGESLVKMPRERFLEFARALQQRGGPRQGGLLEGIERSAFRLEALPIYLVGDERWDAFEKGVVLPPRTPATSPWLRKVAETTAAGVHWSRVHVIDELTTYLRFELLEYRANAEAGEEIRIADRRSHPELADLREDFWLIDAEQAEQPAARAVLMRYSPQGEFLGAWRTEDRAAIAECRRQRDLAWAASVPLEEYLASVGLGERGQEVAA